MLPQDGVPGSHWHVDDLLHRWTWDRHRDRDVDDLRAGQFSAMGAQALDTWLYIAPAATSEGLSTPPLSRVS